MHETLNSITDTLMIVLGGIAAISLVVGGIGIRKAIGARKGNILIQFLIESLIITGFAGLIGIGIGCLIIYIIGKIGLVPAVYSFEWIMIAFGSSLGIGVIFGIFPAYKAASLDPIVALITS